MNMAFPKTKIVCTIGPASEAPEVMKEMILAGMNVARLNFSHGDFEAHKKVIENLRTVSASLGCRIAILADLSGPKMRIGKFASEPVDLNAGDPFTLTVDDIPGDKSRVSVSFTGLPKSVKAGDMLFLNDGYIQLKVVESRGNDVVCTVMVGGELRSRKGLNLPGIDLGISAFTENDSRCLRFALENGVDAVSQSFVEGPADVEAVRQAAADLGYAPFIIAKIERSGALDRIEEIIAASDGIMIARGDLGVEVPIEQIAIIQKRITRLANMRAKPVITATQMLESMTDYRRPTRAEATDVANAILDGTDCVMLSGESAMGKYPVEAVEMLAKIALSAEAQRPMTAVKELFKGIDLRERIRPEHLIAIGVEACFEYVTPAAVFVPTRSGATARSIARFRLPVWTVAVSSEASTCQQLLFSSGIYPVCEAPLPENWYAYVRRQTSSLGLKGNIAILTQGPSRENAEANHSLEILDLTL
ncbi:MAG: Pyruvate kinase [Syntrophus sp. PtaU1.Bin005]|jgi:pyruvate kinase|uniref:pyruvate kinase n=1 Tax=Syntrophus buswellii TaxID=43774 RepID=UPI0009D0037F|nr:MAG: Pyruvate kinase [Syntrophus sp. PtaB.Bin138]OPY83794.1 MAG: Pyruvate kinase [Syntrophus sp. PtaU1.Bin005]